MKHILMSSFKESTERQKKTSFLKETVENADLHKAVLNKTITTQEQSVKYSFVAPLTNEHSLNFAILIINVIFSNLVFISYSKDSCTEKQTKASKKIELLCILPLFKFSVFLCDGFIIFEGKFGHNLFVFIQDSGGLPFPPPGCTPGKEWDWIFQR